MAYILLSRDAAIRMPTVERRKGQLTGQRAADCTVTISKVDGVESLRTISDVSPHAPDGDYKLTDTEGQHTQRGSEARAYGRSCQAAAISVLGGGAEQRDAAGVHFHQRAVFAPQL
jgi:hypothetical protein